MAVAVSKFHPTQNRKLWLLCFCFLCVYLQYKASMREPFKVVMTVKCSGTNLILYLRISRGFKQVYEVFWYVAVSALCTIYVTCFAPTHSTPIFGEKF